MSKKSAILFTLVSMAYLATGIFVWRNLSSHAVDQELKDRAERIFAYDRSHRNKLPSNELASLSIALEFGNDEGARRVLDHLESRAL